MSVESMNASNVAASAQITQQAPGAQQTGAAKTESVNQAALSQVDQSQAAQSEEPSQKMSTEEVQTAVDKLNEFMHNGQRNLNFSIDKDTDDMVVKVMDTETQEVIRQFPSEETIKLTKHIEGMLGLIFNDHA
ncbi:flagellar protein FlaG [Neptunomonas antarctica]|uniref:Flagellar protein FlaG n=1 Tax=Neptunomonas antarctica TaxID=619304 RepID=A0A1N7JBZ9_9GAMM|nr:flagellar protein FlaG [Neptunomonas antarctica]SIS46827.1 flagellar protein FlaG [Neptunomonas antarctica]